MAAAFQLETRLDALLGAGDVRAVQLDLAQVGLVDSAGLGALLAVRERANQMGIDLAITRVSDRVRRILDLTGLADIADS
jgi:anti-anti-sigma factor